MCVLFFVCAYAASLYAETVTVLVSGGIRTRGYYEDNLGDLTDDASGPVTTVADDGTATTTYVQDDEQNYIDTLVDLYVDAELTDSVFVRVGLQTYGVFGTDVFENDNWDVYSWETWLKLANIGGSAWSATAGTFPVDLGRGFLFSSADNYYIFDGIMVDADYMPVVLKAAMLRLDDEGKDDRDMYVVDVDWSGMDSALTLGGTVATIADGPTDYQPIVLDGRVLYNANESIKVFGEIVYETGDSYGDLDKKAWAVEVGGTFTVDVQWSPTIRAMYTFASGDESAADGDDEDFDPLYNYTFYGYAFSPALTNIQIINVGVDLQPTEFTKLFADYYYYTQVEAAAMVVGNINLDNPGVTAMTTGLDDQLGSEVDVGVEHTYTDSVTTSLILSYFMPGDAYIEDDEALEIRGEILVSF
jgi:hypothetical protein